MTVNRGDNLHQKTPEVTVLDNRGLTVRELRYHRHPNTPTTTDERITRHRFTLAGQLAHSIDPRLFDLQQTDSTVNPNMVYETALTGEVVRIRSVDASNTLMLNDITGRPVLAINATEVTRTWQYEHETLPGRPLSITEQPADEATCITERFVWAGNSQAEKNSNLAGQCVRHYDTAGLNQTDSIALNGVPLSVTRRLLPDDTDADWQGDNESVWNDRLAPESFTTLSTADATGALLTRTDAMGNLQQLAYDVAGLLTSSWLTLKNGTEQVIVKSLAYSAASQKLREEHGNGVVTTYTYEPETQRLVGIKTERPPGHAQGAKVLQDLRYEYDPVGNVLRLTNDAESTRFWHNQKVVPENTYSYDSLYQLVAATGREMANIGQQSSLLPTPSLIEGSTYSNYSRTYNYDRGDNLTQIRHSAPASDNSYTTKMTVSDRSNRAVLSTLTENPAEVDVLFTAGGQQNQLQPGQDLVWTPRGELLKVAPVVRNGQVSDQESYRYDADSQRIIKTHVQQTANSSQAQSTLYLPGLERHTTTNGTTVKEVLHVITIGEAGRAQVRVLHWEAGKPDGVSNNQPRYSYDNLIGSSGLEVDGDGQVISLEEYYPYGGTAVWMARNQTEADYKTVRYSGKERDATGLYYYGYRYYQPWAGRWLSADPAGTVDGLNLYRMVRNNPVTFYDPAGLAPAKDKIKIKYSSIEAVSVDNKEHLLSETGHSPTAEVKQSIVADWKYKSEIKISTQLNMLTTGTTRGRTHNYPQVRYKTPDEVQVAPLSTAPSKIWETETMDTPVWDTQYVFGSNREITGHDLYEPLGFMARRNSVTKRAINILSGTHGETLGLNWVDAGKAIIRDPDLIDHDFYKEDIKTQKKIEKGKKRSLKPLIGRVNIIDMDKMNEQAFKHYVTDPANHVILAYCFGRNDNLLRHVRNLNSVTSYVPDHIMHRYP
ncbi:RHS repeat protein [Xenorhabdus bovienii]|uniref:RHS repeat-associated core domain-containing protein n=1 Tax=Xenorhabdus bovienii TaxID=40576 RepID=UPI001EDFF2BA|nr:RHS repeat-associated core domain-containing protein [Xenorhabdus bovienii]MCG3460808.1 RHS repeat protein [Xenorhabdus bovienii]